MEVKITNKTIMSSRKSIEEKITTCAANMQFLKVTHKECGQGFLAEEKVVLSDKTFINNPNFVILYSCRIIGTKSNIVGFMDDPKSSISSALRKLMELDLAQAITCEDFRDESATITLYNFTRDKGDYLFITSKTTNKCDIFNNEVNHNKDEKQKKRDTDLQRRILLSKVSEVLYILKNEPSQGDKDSYLKQNKDGRFTYSS